MSGHPGFALGVRPGFRDGVAPKRHQKASAVFLGARERPLFDGIAR
jgi:hypothetical protein